MPKTNFTKKWIEGLPMPKEKRSFHYDTATRGLGILVQPTGHKSFFWFRKVNGRPTWQTIGAFPDLSIENARQKAAEFNAKLSRWKADSYDGPNPFEKNRDVTLGQLAADYIERQIKAHAAHPDRAVKDVTDMAKTYLTPWKNRRLGAISRRDVLGLHAKLGEQNGKVTANRVVQFLRTLYNWADKVEAWGGENPARNIKMFHEEPRTRFLQPDEMPRLFRALGSEASFDLQDFVLLALFTGARRNDVLSMRWENLSLSDNRWEVPKPKNRKPYQVALTPEVVETLQKRMERRKNDSPWVFPSRGKTGHIVSLKKPWKELLKRAKIANLTMHDLRRTFGAYQAAKGTSLQIIGKSLGHATIAATQRSYAPLDLDPIRESVNAATQAMLAASKKKPKQLTRGSR